MWTTPPTSQRTAAVSCEALGIAKLPRFCPWHLAGSSGAGPQGFTVWLPSVFLALWAHSKVPSCLHTFPGFSGLVVNVHKGASMSHGL